MVRTLMRSKLVGLMFGQTTKKRDSSKSHSVASTEAAVFCFASGGKLWWKPGNPGAPFGQRHHWKVRVVFPRKTTISRTDSLA